MRITHEADYAIRILFCLAINGGKMGAKELSEHTGVTPRFTLKILRKLTGAGLVQSYKGMKGGYVLNVEADEISIGRVIELIDGPLRITHCLDENFQCSRIPPGETCEVHEAFEGINRKLRDELYELKLSTFMRPQA